MAMAKRFLIEEIIILMRLVLNWDIVQQAILYHHLKKDMGLLQRYM